MAGAVHNIFDLMRAVNGGAPQVVEHRGNNKSFQALLNQHIRENRPVNAHVVNGANRMALRSGRSYIPLTPGMRTGQGTGAFAVVNAMNPTSQPNIGSALYSVSKPADADTTYQETPESFRQMLVPLLATMLMNRLVPSGQGAAAQPATAEQGSAAAGTDQNEAPLNAIALAPGVFLSKTGSQLILPGNVPGEPVRTIEIPAEYQEAFTLFVNLKGGKGGDGQEAFPNSHLQRGVAPLSAPSLSADAIREKLKLFLNNGLEGAGIPAEINGTDRESLASGTEQLLNKILSGVMNRAGAGNGAPSLIKNTDGNTTHPLAALFFQDREMSLQVQQATESLREAIRNGAGSAAGAVNDILNKIDTRHDRQGIDTLTSQNLNLPAGSFAMLENLRKGAGQAKPADADTTYQETPESFRQMVVPLLATMLMNRLVPSGQGAAAQPATAEQGSAAAGTDQNEAPLNAIALAPGVFLSKTGSQLILPGNVPGEPVRTIEIPAEYQEAFTLFVNLKGGKGGDGQEAFAGTAAHGQARPEYSLVSFLVSTLLSKESQSNGANGGYGYADDRAGINNEDETNTLFKDMVSTTLDKSAKQAELGRQTGHQMGSDRTKVLETLFRGGPQGQSVSSAQALKGTPNDVRGLTIQKEVQEKGFFGDPNRNDTAGIGRLTGEEEVRNLNLAAGEAHLDDRLERAEAAYGPHLRKYQMNSDGHPVIARGIEEVAHEVLRGSKTAEMESNATVIADRIEKIVKQYGETGNRIDMMMKLKLDERETIIVKLRDMGQQIRVEIKTADSGLTTLLQSQKQIIERVLEAKDIHTSITVNPDGQNGYENRERKDQQQREATPRRNGPSRDFVELFA